METTPHHNLEPVSPEYWTDLLRPVFQDKKVIVAGDVIAGLLPRARQIQALGAESTFMLATEGMGTGETPADQDGDWIALDAQPAEDIIEAIHTGNALLGNLPKHAHDAIDWYDPKHQAIVVGSFLHEQPEVAGRPSLAYRKPEWLALDDKTIIDSVWDEIGITREPSEVVDVERGAVLEATRRLDRGDGVVWSGDSRDGISGGATGVRWIRSEADIDKALEYYAKHCDQLRVMPFLEGIPCSIHGMVFEDYVAAFRPVEMVVLRKPDSHEFFYGGTATFWDPKPEDREDMRSIAKRVGNALRDKVNYRGLFTVDGVMTKDGFRPTELNPRSGAGVKPLLAGTPELPLELVAQALVAGSDLDYNTEALESLIISAADKQRSGGTWSAVKVNLPAIDNRPVKYTDDGWKWTKAENADGAVSVGPGPLGSFVRLSPNNDVLPTGTSFGSMARDFWHFADREMNSNIGTLEAAKSVRQ